MALIGQLQHVALMLALSPWLAFLVKLYVVVGELNDALFRAGLINELHLTICPKIFGGRRAPTIAEGIGVPKLSMAAQLKLKSMKRIGDELFVVYIVDPKS